jgi:hypothetical protein
LLKVWDCNGVFKSGEENDTLEEARRKEAVKRGPIENRDPHWCEPEKDDVKAEAVKMLIKNTRFVHGFVAALFDYVDNTEGSIRMMSLAKAIPHLGALPWRTGLS